MHALKVDAALELVGKTLQKWVLLLCADCVAAKCYNCAVFKKVLLVCVNANVSLSSLE